MDLWHLGNATLFRPRLIVEQAMKIEAERHLREGYASGTYTDPGRVSEILRYHFAFFQDRISESLPNVASRHFLEFCLAQYDESSIAEDDYKAGRLSAAEKRQWLEINPPLRRAIKYLVELLVTLAPSEAPSCPPDSILHHTDVSWICAEQLVMLSQLADQTFHVYPDRTRLEIFPEGRPLYFDLGVAGFDPGRFRNRIARTRERTLSLFPRDEDIELLLSVRTAALDTPFLSELGFSFDQAVALLRHLINTTVVPPDQFDVPFVRRKLIIDGVSQDDGLERAAVERLLDGFSVRRADLSQTPRRVWLPNQEYRAWHRGFFEFPHPTGIHLAWSRRMARESLINLWRGVLFQKLPKEWRIGAVRPALASLSNQAGAWFERACDRALREIGFVAAISRKRIGTGAGVINLERECGEMDYLGYCRDHRLLLVGELKYVRAASEARLFASDLDGFVRRDDSYARQAVRKLNWVRLHLAEVIAALDSDTMFPLSAEDMPVASVAGVIITRYPSIAAELIADIPCVALAEFHDDFATANNWPYSNGIWPA